MRWRYLVVLIFPAQISRLLRYIVDELLQNPSYQLRRMLLDLSNLFVSLHDLLDTVERKFLSMALFHF